MRTELLVLLAKLGIVQLLEELVLNVKMGLLQEVVVSVKIVPQEMVTPTRFQEPVYLVLWDIVRLLEEFALNVLKEGKLFLEVRAQIALQVMVQLLEDFVLNVQLDSLPTLVVLALIVLLAHTLLVAVYARIVRQGSVVHQELHLVILVILDKFRCKVDSVLTDVLLVKLGLVCLPNVSFVQRILSQFLVILVVLDAPQINMHLNKVLHATLMALLEVK